MRLGSWRIAYSVYDAQNFLGRFLHKKLTRHWSGDGVCLRARSMWRTRVGTGEVEIGSSIGHRVGQRFLGWPDLARVPCGGGMSENTGAGRTLPQFEPGEDRGFTKVKADLGSEVFTKLDNVKSRISWTPERRQLLQAMWERGEKAPAIAAAIGCNVGAINVARARFGLKPRRVVSGRPKQELDEPAHKIERVAITTSRLMEFASEKELVAQTGHQAYEWPRVIVKELVDNGIDAAEEAEIAPVITVTITTGKSGMPTRLVVEDNGRGIPPETIAGIIDYDKRVSSREAYISPTRGRQGNALKTILPMSYVVGGKIKGETWIEARGIKHRLIFSVNQIKQEPIVKNIQPFARHDRHPRIGILARYRRRGHRRR